MSDDVVRAVTPTLAPVWRGTARMDRDMYLAMAARATGYVTTLVLYPNALDDLDGIERCAVYIVVNRLGDVCYVGQTRSGVNGDGAVHERMRQHLRDPSKADEWRMCWMIPLDDRTPQTDLNRIERDICARLGVPLQNRRWRRRAAS
ncbi:hypothetical protein BH09ACT12_BH09ACT12_04940 [soil metagenome]